MDKLKGKLTVEINGDILDIIINVWSHGYAHSQNGLSESESVADAKMKLSRRPIGRVHIANSDSGWSPYAHTAIQEAHRAVEEICG